MNAEISKIHENLKQFDGLTLDRLFMEIDDTYGQLSRINAMADAAGGLKNLLKDDQDSHKNRSQQMMQLVSTAYNKGWGSLLAGKLSRLDSSYAEEDLNDPENVHKVALGLVGAVKHDKVKDAESAAKVQEKVRKALKDKGGILFRTLQTGMTNAANSKGQAHFYAQMGDGRDQLGAEYIGFSNLMKAGIGDGTRLGSGGSTAGIGVTKRRIKNEALADFTIDSSSDARVFVSTFIDKEGNEVAEEIRGELEDAVLGVVNKSADQILKMSTPLLNFVSGGNYSSSSYNAGSDQFKMKSQKMVDFMKKLNSAFDTRYGAATNAQAKSRVLESWRAFYRQLGVPNANSLSETQLKSMHKKFTKV
jgi:hypothetical protein